MHRHLCKEMRHLILKLTSHGGGGGIFEVMKAPQVRLDLLLI